MTSLVGDKKLMRKLSELGPKVERKVCRRAVNRGASILLKRIRREAPVGETNEIKKQTGKKINAKVIGIIVAKVGVGVGVRTRRKRNQRKGHVYKHEPHAHLVAMGTKARYTGERVRKTKLGETRKETGNKRAYRGVMPKNPFVRRGAAGGSSECLSVIREAVKQGIEIEARQ